MYAVIVLLAFFAGLVSRSLGFPPMLGYLVTGFVAQHYGVGSADDIEPFANLGITLLLFTIGLKLNLRKLAAPEIWAVASLHMGIAMLLSAPVIYLAGFWLDSLAVADTVTIWTLAFALSFSSTVFAVKIFESRGESTSIHATIAIGILIIQDLIAVVYLVATSDKSPNFYTALLLLLPLARPLLLLLMRKAGHGELLLLFGIGAAIGGYQLFELVNLKGGLGAIIFGVLLGNTSKSNELYRNLVQLKDLFLIGFFLQIGYYGLPSADMWIMALMLCVVLLLRPVFYFALFVLFKLRARTACLSGMSLFNYSEFGLIVAAIAVEAGAIPVSWLTTLALAMTVSFFLSTPVNTRIHTLFAHYLGWLHRFERSERLPAERFPDLGNAEIAVLGMGRVGAGAYNYLVEHVTGNIVGIEENERKASELQAQGFNCVHGDASDQVFWEHTGLNRCKKIFICLTNHRENLFVVNMAREIDFNGDIAVISLFPDHEKELEALGCITFNMYKEAGHGFAEHVMAHLGAPQAAHRT